MSPEIQFVDDHQLPAGTEWALVEKPTAEESILFVKRSACTGQCGSGCLVLAEVLAIA